MRRLLFPTRRWTTPLGVAAAVMVALAAEANELDDTVRSGDVAATVALLGSSAAFDLDAPARDGLTPLLWATQTNDQALVRVLLEAGADANATNRYGLTALWLAAINRNPDMTRLLLAQGADATLALPHGETPVMAAARSGDAASIHLLVAAGTDPNAAEAKLGETALMWAAAEDQPDAVRALVEGGADPDLASRVLKLAPMDWVQVGMVSTVLPVGGWTPLMFAAREDAQQASLALIERGASPDLKDPDGNTALLLAIANDHYDLAAALLEAGADPNAADGSGMAALFAAIDRASSAPDFGRPIVPRLDRYDALDLVRVAIEHGANLDARLEGATLARHHGFPDRSLGAGATPIMRAVQARDLDSLRLLLSAGASITVQTEDGSSVLHVLAAAPAARGDEALREREALDLLLAAGADLEASDATGGSPLHRAARSGNAGFIELLVERGARLDAVDHEARTPRDLVTLPGRSNHPEIAELLRRLAAE